MASSQTPFDNRTIPYSASAERAVLGSVLIDPESFGDVVNTLTEKDFYLSENQDTFLSMQEIYESGKPIDPVNLRQKLVQKGTFDEAGCDAYLAEMASSTPNAFNIQDYAKIVKDKSTLRQVIDNCEKISSAAFAGQDEVTDIVSTAALNFQDILNKRDNKDFATLKDTLVHVLGSLKEKAVHGDKPEGVATGFSCLDNVLVELGKGDFVIIGARPGMGKTSLAMNIATNVAKKTDKAVCIFSLEMSADQLVTRMISGEAKIDSYSLRTGQLTDDQWKSLALAASDLNKCNIYIDDTSGQTVSGMRSKLSRLKKDQLGLVVIDYLQLMQSSRKAENRVNEVSEISRGLKLLAKELGVPVICCSQLSRNTESAERGKKSSSRIPQLSDLRDSGAIEQDADIVMFIYRDEYYNTDPTADAPNDAGVSTAVVSIAKNRHGAQKVVHIGWLGRYTQFIGLVKDGDPTSSV